MNKNILIVIDYQTDFVTGALANSAAAELEDGIQAKVRSYLEAGKPVIFTKDTHLDDYLETREGRFLPVPHCIRGSEGWGLYGGLAEYEQGVTDGVMIVEKATFGSPALPAAVRLLCGGEPERVELCGVVTDICVVSNAILLHSEFLRAEIAVDGSLCAAMTKENHDRALALLAGMGYSVL